MFWPIAAAVATTLLQVQASNNAASAEARQERQNSDYYFRQAQLAKLAAERQEELSWQEYAIKASTQMSKYAGGNVDLSGSAALTLGATLGQAVKEMWAIREKGKMEYDLARMRGHGAAARSSALDDPSTGFFRNAGIVAQSAASFIGARGLGWSKGGNDTSGYQ